MTNCAKCGESLLPNAIFCAVCGARANASEAATLPLKQAAANFSPETPSPADPEPAPQPPISAPISVDQSPPTPPRAAAPPTVPNWSSGARDQMPVQPPAQPPRAASPTVPNWPSGGSGQAPQQQQPGQPLFQSPYQAQAGPQWQAPPVQHWGGPPSQPTTMGQPMPAGMPMGAPMGGRTVPNWPTPAPPPPPSFGASPVANKFIDTHKNAWQRLEELLALMGATSLRRLHREEVRELGNSYRRTASDLAVARAESRDPRLINYLNSLVIRAHGRIYTADARGGHRLRNFFVRDFPQTFRRTWRFTGVAFLVFMIFFGVGFLGSWRDADFSEFAGVSSEFRSEVLAPKIRWWKSLNEANQIGSSKILTNNIQVCFIAFALGAFFAVGTLYVMASNGASIGAVLALTYKAGYGNELLTFMAGHGVIELSCIFISGGAGMMIGYSILVPGDLSRADALKTSGLEAVRLMAGVALLLVVAGIIEGFISPAEISPFFKFGIAAITFVALYGYLLLAGRDDAPEETVAGGEPVST